MLENYIFFNCPIWHTGTIHTSVEMLESDFMLFCKVSEQMLAIATKVDQANCPINSEHLGCFKVFSERKKLDPYQALRMLQVIVYIEKKNYRAWYCKDVRHIWRTVFEKFYKLFRTAYDESLVEQDMSLYYYFTEKQKYRKWDRIEKVGLYGDYVDVEFLS